MKSLPAHPPSVGQMEALWDAHITRPDSDPAQGACLTMTMAALIALAGFLTNNTIWVSLNMITV